MLHVVGKRKFVDKNRNKKIEKNDNLKMINGFCFSFLSMCSNLLEKTTDAVIKSAKNGDLSLVSKLLFLL